MSLRFGPCVPLPPSNDGGMGQICMALWPHALGCNTWSEELGPAPWDRSLRCRVRVQWASHVLYWSSQLQWTQSPFAKIITLIITPPEIIQTLTYLLFIQELHFFWNLYYMFSKQYAVHPAAYFPYRKMKWGKFWLDWWCKSVGDSEWWSIWQWELLISRRSNGWKMQNFCKLNLRIWDGKFLFNFLS